MSAGSPEPADFADTADTADSDSVNLDLLDELETECIDDDVGNIKRKYMSKFLPDDGEFNSSQVPIDTISKREVQDLIENVPKPMVQRPVQPGSTPNDEENRFLCWNNTGIIRAQFGAEDQGIDVMFHDTEKHSSVNFKNETNYTYGSLSEDCIVVGSNGKYNTGPASIHGIDLLETNREQREWDVNLPHVELIEALAVGSGFVAVATDQRMLRLFTSGGMQSYLFTLPGQVLCMSAYEQNLMIVYHNGAGHSDDQNLSMLVYKIDLIGQSIRQVYGNIPVALSKRSPLSWCGFSDEGTPCTYDYSGMLRMYRHELGKVWVPMLDLRQLTSSALDHYFVVGLSEISQAVRAVKCRRSRYPEFTAETAEMLTFSLPMCDTDTDKGMLEQEHIRLRLAGASYKRLSHIESVSSLADTANASNEKLLVNTILRLFAMYLKEDREELAKNLVYMMPKDHMSKLPEYAWKINRPSYFIDAINRAIDDREQMEVDIAAKEDDLISIASISPNKFGKDLRKELKKSHDNDTSNEENRLKPIPLDKLMTNTRTPEKERPQLVLDDDSADENDSKLAKRTKSINYNLFSKKRPRNV